MPSPQAEPGPASNPIKLTAAVRRVPHAQSPLAAVSAVRARPQAHRTVRRTPSRPVPPPAAKYQQRIPLSVKTAFVSAAKVTLTGEEPLYRDVARHSGIRWELLAACDWMQCRARPRYSPVHGEKLGTVNPDGTCYRSRSAALEQCARDLVELSDAIYHIDLAVPGELSVRDLASAFAAFRWGGLLNAHHVSAVEFPYSVAGLTDQHLKMRWPHIDEASSPDKAGARFKMPFGAVPIVLCLNYPATV